MDHTERCGRYGNRKTVLQYLLSMSLARGWIRREIPAETRGKLVLVSWPFCAISEDHVAGAAASLLESKAEAKGYCDTSPSIGGLPWARSCYRDHGIVLTVACDSSERLQGVKTRICKVYSL